MTSPSLHAEHSTIGSGFMRHTRPWRDFSTAGKLAVLCSLALTGITVWLAAASAQTPLLVCLALAGGSATIISLFVALRRPAAPPHAADAAPHLAMLEDAMQSLSEGVALYDPDDRLVWFNQRFRELRNVNSLSCQIGAHFGDILRSGVACGEAPMPAEGVEAWVRARLADRQKPIGSKLQLRNGRWLRVTDRRTRDGSVISVHSDVTELKAAETAAKAARTRIERQAEMLSTLIENLQVGVSLVDGDGRFMALNKLWLDLCNLPPGSFELGDSFESFVRYLADHGDFSEPDVEAAVGQMIESAKCTEPLVFERTRRNGRVIEIRRVPLPSGGFVSTYIDITDARRRETEVQEARARLERQTEVLSTLIENLQVGVGLVDVSGRIVAFNRDWVELIDLPQGKLQVGDTFESVIRYLADHGDFSEPDVEAAVRQIIDGAKRTEPYIFERTRRNGRVIEVRHVPVRSGGFVRTFIDVTDAHRRESDLQEARGRLERQTEIFSTLIENLNIGVSLVGADGRFLAFNRAHRELYDLPPGKFKPGDTFESFIRYLAEQGDFGLGDDIEAIVSERVARAMTGAAAEFERTRPNGRVLQIRRAPLPSGGFVGAFIDVTEARHREADLGEAHARLERQTEVLSTLIENLSAGVALVDADGRFMALNEAYLDLYDIPRGTFKPGDTFESCIRYMVEHGDFTDGSDIEATLRRIVERAMRPEPQHFERKRSNGRAIEIRRVPLPRGGFVTTYIDVTEARGREADLQEARAGLERQATELVATAHNLQAANAAKSTFLANMSHELRTPLNAILGFAEVMRDAMLGPLNARYRDYAKDIHVSGAYLLRLINDILDTSKIAAGQMRLEQESIDLTELIAECERLVLDRARGAGVAVAYEISPRFPPIAGDRLRIKQVLLNLLVNAIKFTPAGGNVRLSAAASKPRGIDITIADTGIGMEPNSIARALEPFQQLDYRLARRYEGTGLGLPLAKSLIELHGGTLTIESAPGHGTIVRVWLPPERLLDERPTAPALKLRR